MKKSVLIMSLLLLSACSKSFETTETQTDAELQKPILESQKAQDYAAWHSSENNPDQVFSGLIQKYMAHELTDEEICQSFDKLSVVDLALYENSIRQEEKAFILKPCRSGLLVKLDAHWNEERRLLRIPIKKTFAQLGSLGDVGLNSPETGNSEVAAPAIRRFDSAVEVIRDVSEGYFAVTGDLDPGQVALTFDDGPSNLYTNDILTSLAAANVKVTFFVMGNNVRRYPDQLKAVALAGHAIGTHTQTHRCQAASARCQANNNGKRLTFAEAYADMTSGHKAVKDILGWVYPFFRFPYGESSPELKDLLKRTGVGEFYWSIDSNDWRTYRPNSQTAYTASDMIENVFAQLKSKKRGQVLFHDIQKKTAVALPAILNRLYDEGYQPVVFMPADAESITNSKLLNTLNDPSILTAPSIQSSAQ